MFGGGRLKNSEFEISFKVVPKLGLKIEMIHQVNWFSIDIIHRLIKF